jgi:hypothetical protein
LLIAGWDILNMAASQEISWRKIQKIDSYKVFNEDQSNGFHPVLFLDDHGSLL